MPAVSGVAAYLAMGGYAVFVWPAYGLTFAVLGGLALNSWRRYRAQPSPARSAAAAIRGRGDDPQAAAARAAGARHDARSAARRRWCSARSADNLVFFYSPSDLKTEAIAADRPVRIGGLVERRSVTRRPADVRIRVPHHRRQDRCPGRLSRHAAGSVSRGAGSGRRRQARARRGLCRRDACWPSMTSTTCRAKSSTR